MEDLKKILSWRSTLLKLKLKVLNKMMKKIEDYKNGKGGE